MTMNRSWIGVNDDGSGTTGTVVNVAYINAFCDAIDAALTGALRVAVYNNAVQSIPNAAHTALLFNSEEYDVTGIHSTSVNTSRLTIPTGGAGVWRFDVNAYWDINATGQRLARFYKNGAAIGPASYQGASAVSGVTHNFGVSLTVADADYIEVFVYQDRGGALDIGFAGSPGTASCRLQGFKLA